LEEKKNVRKAYFLIFLSIIVFSLFFFFGLPAVAKFAAFLTELRQSSTAYEPDDTTPPTPPKFNALPTATNDKEIEISGRTEPGVTVKLFVNDNEIEILSNSDGEFFQKITLSGGSNTISAYAVDNSGNESAPSEEHIVVYDLDPPSLEVSKPDDGASFFGSQQRQLVIEGSTDENASVNINGRIVVVSSDGSFSFATTLNEGENIFNITAQDQAENKNELTISVTYSP
jgi:hypothetical protein